MRRGGRACFVPQCNNTAFKTKESFYFFPCDKTLRREWICKLRTDKEPSNWAQVCSAHFQDEDFTYSRTGKCSKKYLKKTAVPSKNLPKLSVMVNRPSLPRPTSAKRELNYHGPILSGIDEMAQSSYSAINFAHKSSLKQELLADVNEHQPDFGFMEVDVDQVQPDLNLSDATSVDPLLLPKYEPHHVTQEVKVKQEPGESDSSSVGVGEFHHVGLQDHQDVDPLQLPTSNATTCEPRQVEQEVMVKQEPGESDSSSVGVGQFYFISVQNVSGEMADDLEGNSSM